MDDCAHNFLEEFVENNELKTATKKQRNSSVFRVKAGFKSILTEGMSAASVFHAL